MSRLQEGKIGMSRFGEDGNRECERAIAIAMDMAMNLSLDLRVQGSATSSPSSLLRWQFAMSQITLAVLGNYFWFFIHHVHTWAVEGVPLHR